MINSNWHPISYCVRIVATYCSNFGHCVFEPTPFPWGLRDNVRYSSWLVELFSLGVTAEALRAKIHHVEKALRSCGYPDWTFRKVKDRMRVKSTERKQKSEQKKSTPCRVAICGRHIRKGVLGDEETSGACYNETSQDFEKATVASEGQTREGRNQELCVQNSVQQLWEDLHRWDWKIARDKTKRT